MPDSTSQPTVLVKKSDGTFVRLTLDEVRKLKGKTQGGNETKVENKLKTEAGANADQKPQSKSKSESESKSQSVPQSSQSFNPDFAAPLDEPVALAAASAKPEVSSRQDHVDSVMKALSFFPPKDLVNRLRTIIQLRLKDIRSEEQTREVLVRPALSGGMDLTAPQAEEVLKLCAKTMGQDHLETTQTPTIRDLKASAQTKALMVEGKNDHALATATPHNTFVHGELKSTAPAARPKAGVNPPQAPVFRGTIRPAEAHGSPEVFKLHTEPREKPTMHDVTPPIREIGPVDELRTITLVDFRRLATTPTESALRLKQKFVNLRDESVLLYIEALSAWRASPLFRGYVSELTSALAERKKLGQANGRGDALTAEEMKALISMENELPYFG